MIKAMALFTFIGCRLVIGKSIVRKPSRYEYDYHSLGPHRSMMGWFPEVPCQKPTVQEILSSLDVQAEFLCYALTIEHILQR